MTLAPVERIFGSFKAQGFSCRYSYNCPSHPVYMITDHGSWEPGGTAVGNTILLRGNNPPVTTITDSSQRYSSEWYLPEIVNIGAPRNNLAAVSFFFSKTPGNVGAIISNQQR